MKHKIFKLIYFDTLINTVGFKFDHVNGPLFLVTFHKGNIYPLFETDRVIYFLECNTQQNLLLV